MALVESFVFGCCIIILIKFLQMCEKHSEMKKTLESIPEPKLFPVIGFPLKVFGAKKMFDFIINITKVEGSPVKLWYWISKVVVVLDTPDDIKIVLNSENCIDKAPYYKYLNLGKGLFVSQQDLWKKNRKILSRAIHSKMLETSIPIISEKSRKLVNIFNEKVEGEEFDIMDNVIDSILETMFETILDTKTNYLLRNKYRMFAER